MSSLYLLWCLTVCIGFMTCQPPRFVLVNPSGICGGLLSPCQEDHVCHNLFCEAGTRCFRTNEWWWECSPDIPNAADTFVHIKDMHLMLQGHPFYFVGANAYWIMDESINDNFPTDQRVAHFFHLAQMNGITVVRTWAFLHDMPVRPTEYKASTLQRLDFVVATAQKYGIKLQLTLGNYWTDYKAPEQWVAHAYGTAAGRTIRDFYMDPLVRHLFFEHIQFIISRVNSITGIPFRNDTTIMMWDILNEPRFSGATPEERQAFLEWVGSAAALIKSLDPNHLVAVGTEGFFTTDDPSPLNRYNPGHFYECEGIGWVPLNRLKDVDIAVVHIYPEHLTELPISWDPTTKESQWIQCDFACRLNWLEQWIWVHSQVAAQYIGKPFIIQEIGVNIWSWSETTQKQWIQLSFDALMDSARKREALAGVMFWNAALRGFPNYDGLNKLLEDINNQVLQVGVDPKDFRRFSLGGQCGAAVARSGWTPAYQLSGKVDIDRLDRHVSRKSITDIVADSARTLLQIG